MTTPAITMIIPGARTLDQLTSATFDGHPDEDARENCVAATLAEGLNMLVAGGARKYVPDELHDAVYGQGYLGTQAAWKYVGYCANQGVALTAVDGATQAALIAIIHKEVSAGHPVAVTMPSEWNTAPADPRHPSGSTHVGLAVGIGPDAIRVMNPWHGWMQDASDEWWAARLCEGQVWVMTKKASSPVTTTTTSGVPAGWHDDGTWLTAPNGMRCGTGMRAKVLGWPGGWPAWNVPVDEERHSASLELSRPEVGAGTQQVFRATVLEWTPKSGVFVMAVGTELQATRDALTKALAELAAAQGQISSLQSSLQQAQQAAAQQAAQQASSAQASIQPTGQQAQAGDELTRAAAHEFGQVFATTFATQFAQALVSAMSATLSSTVSVSTVAQVDAPTVTG